MNFARKELEKYGWSEGQALGKTQNGLKNALKPKLKFDNCGLGYDLGAQFSDNWWERLFNKTANTINVETNKDDIKMHVTPENSVNNVRKHEDSQYSGFLKTSRLVGTTVTNYNNNNNNFNENSNETPSSFSSLTDEELLAACSGRTAHKGARHGLKQSGKLSRIEKQEKILLKKMKKVSLSNNEDDGIDKKLKKLKKQMEKYCTIESGEKISTNLKKKKKQKKSVSFNDTVTKIIPVDLDTSLESEVDSSTMGDEHCDEVLLGNVTSGSEEGAEHEQDHGNNDNLHNYICTGSTLFHDVRDLSKAERKKLKMKKKLKAERNTFVEDSLKYSNTTNSDEILLDSDDRNKNLKKRKCLNEFDSSFFQTEYHKIDSDKNWNKKKRGKTKD